MEALITDFIPSFFSPNPLFEGGSSPPLHFVKWFSKPETEQSLLGLNSRWG